MIPFTDLRAEYKSIKTQIDHAITHVFDENLFVGGDRVSKFEQEFATYLKVKVCVTCGNGSDALEIALKALGIGPGDEVIVPALSWVSTADAVNNVGAEPVFVDILDREYTLDPNLIEDVITDQTKAIIPVHLYGLPARMPEILQLARKYELKVIEDCAQAHGASINGVRVGSFGDVGTFSFYPSKNLGAYGDAGAIVTNDEAVGKKIRRLTNHGQLKKHDHHLLGRNSRMDTLQAAVLSVKLMYLDGWNASRREVAQWYRRYLKEEILFQKIPEEYSHVFHLMAIPSENRASLISALEREKIAYGIHYPCALPFLKCYLFKGYEKDQFPVAKKLCDRVISLPMFASLEEGNIKFISSIVNKVV